MSTTKARRRATSPTVPSKPDQAAWTATLIPIGAVKPYPGNPRKNEAAVAKVSASIREFGFRQPIVTDEEGVVIAGHTRLLAAQALGLEAVPVHVAKGLTPAQVKAYRLADNRVAQEAEWDMEALRVEIGELSALDFDLGLTGFDDGELSALLSPAQGLQPGVDPDDVPPVPVAPITKPGDLIILGRHRLHCGDSTSADDLGRLMIDDRAEVLWTDPPYGVGYIGKTKRALTIQNDTGDLGTFLASVFEATDRVLNPGARFYVASPAGSRATEIRVALASAGWALHQGLVWVKDAMVLGHSDYHYRHEDILYGYKPGEGRIGRGAHKGTRWYGDHSQVSVFEIARPKRSEQHPTMKPVELVSKCLANSAKPGDIVLDVFGGSGTTMIAAETLAMSARLIEIDPLYCDVIVSRWENATGQKAVRP